MFNQYRDVVSVAELCEMLGVGKNTAYQLLHTGKIKAVRIGKVYKISKASVIHFLKN